MNRDRANHKDIEISVIVPTYRSAHSAEELTSRLVKTLEEMHRRYEIIFVDDGSPDNTWQILTEIKRESQAPLVLIRLEFNVGQHNAILCGLQHAHGHILVTIDDDLQVSPEDIPKLVEKMEQDKLDLVYGNYPVRRHNLLRNLAAIPIYLFANHFFRLKVATTSFRAIRADIVTQLNAYRGPFPVIDGILCWSTRRIGAVAVEHRPRPHGRSTYTIAKLISLAVSIFTNFSLIPIRMLSLAGLLLVICGIWQWLREQPTVGAILLVGGMQLAALSVVGEYVGRVLLRLNGQPTFLVRESIGVSEDVDAEFVISRGAGRSS